MMAAPRPLVSVCLITYNHEDLIGQAMESALAQTMLPDMELVVGDDGSTDRTRDVVTALAARHPNRVRTIFHPENTGLLANFMRTFAACRGEFVALLDGDDYWTLDSKIDRQVTALREHPACSICFHDVAVQLSDGSFYSVTYTRPDQAPVTGVEDLLEQNYIATCSVLLRRSFVPVLPSWFAEGPWEDWPLYLLLAEQGPILYLPELMGVYRAHGRGLWSQLDHAAKIQAQIDFLLAMDRRMNHRYSDRIAHRVSRFRDELRLIQQDAS
jgi:glycosyltransferase involved in cell wall biosynthesis